MVRSSQHVKKSININRSNNKYRRYSKWKVKFVSMCVAECSGIDGGRGSEEEFVSVDVWFLIHLNLCHECRGTNCLFPEWERCWASSDIDQHTHTESSSGSCLPKSFGLFFGTCAKYFPPCAAAAGIPQNHTQTWKFSMMPRWKFCPPENTQEGETEPFSWSVRSSGPGLMQFPMNSSSVLQHCCISIAVISEQQPGVWGINGDVVMSWA